MGHWDRMSIMTMTSTFPVLAPVKFLSLLDTLTFMPKVLCEGKQLGRAHGGSAWRAMSSVTRTVFPAVDRLPLSIPR
jgi:hypothetical protein